MLSRWYGIYSVVYLSLISLSISVISVCGTIRFTAVSGEITSPNYPSDYPNNVYCRYTLVRPYHGLTELKSTRMDLESSSTCGYDYVRVSTLRQRQNGHHCANGIFNITYFFTKVQFALPQIMAQNLWCHVKSLGSDEVFYHGVGELSYFKQSIALTWWRHQIETFSALLAICAGNSPITSDFHAKASDDELWCFLWSAPE